MLHRAAAVHSVAEDDALLGLARVWRQHLRGEGKSKVQVACVSNTYAHMVARQLSTVLQKTMQTSGSAAHLVPAPKVEKQAITTIRVMQRVRRKEVRVQPWRKHLEVS